MKKTIILVFTAAALLMVAAVTLDSYGRDVYKYHMAAAADLLPPLYRHPLLESWERAADVTWLLALGVLVAGIKLSAEPQPAHRVSMLGLRAGPPGRIARAASPSVLKTRADAARLPRLHDDEGFTPLERVIRGR